MWTCDGIKESYLCPSVVSLGGIVYTIGARSATSLAVKAGGRGDVSGTHFLWTKRGGSNVTSPAIFGEHLYWVSDSGMAFCLKADSGEAVYQERLGGGVYASATIADGKIYVVSQKNGTYVLAVGPKFERLAMNRSPTPAPSTPARRSARGRYSSAPISGCIAWGRSSEGHKREIRVRSTKQIPMNEGEILKLEQSFVSFETVSLRFQTVAKHSCVTGPAAAPRAPAPRVARRS